MAMRFAKVPKPTARNRQGLIMQKGRELGHTRLAAAFLRTRKQASSAANSLQPEANRTKAAHSTARTRRRVHEARLGLFDNQPARPRRPLAQSEPAREKVQRRVTGRHADMPPIDIMQPVQDAALRTTGRGDERSGRGTAGGKGGKAGGGSGRSGRAGDLVTFRAARSQMARRVTAGLRPVVKIDKAVVDAAGDFEARRFNLMIRALRHDRSKTFEEKLAIMRALQEEQAKSVHKARENAMLQEKDKAKTARLLTRLVARNVARPQRANQGRSPDMRPK